MKEKSFLYQTYPDSPRATNLSMAGGAVRLVSILCLIAAVPFAIAVITVMVRLTGAAGFSVALMYALDELDEVLFASFLFLCAAVAGWFVSMVLRSKAQLLAFAGQEQGQEQAGETQEKETLDSIGEG